MNSALSIAGRMAEPSDGVAGTAHALHVRCDDGVVLAAQLWRGGPARSVVIINPATGVLARYYHRYAAFLAGHGHDVITYDYRGIGGSRPAALRGCGYRGSDWGTLDFAAVLEEAERLAQGRPIMVVGHSIGGFIPGLAPRMDRCAAMLTVGAQYAYWRDYARWARLSHCLKWHLAMPAITALLGYFPGRRIGWLEDLPAGVAFEWAFRGARMEQSLPRAERAEIIRRLAAFQGPLLAVTTSDDPFGTPAAIARGLSYYTGARRSLAVIEPADIGCERVGHFDLFHSRHRDTFWKSSARWLESGGRWWDIGIIRPVTGHSLTKGNTHAPWS